MSEFLYGREPQFVAICGRLSVGKDTSGNYLADEHGFLHLSTGDILRTEATARGLDATNRALLSDVATDLRRHYGSGGVLVLNGIKQWQASRDAYQGGLVVTGIRMIAEARETLQHNGLVWFMEADFDRRYQWAKGRSRDEREAMLTRSYFRADDDREYYGVEDPGKPNGKVIKMMADFVIHNNATTRALYDSIDKALGLH